MPKLPEPIIKEIGYDNKKILLKKNIFTKNHTNHSDIPIELNKEILDKSIYHGTFFVKDKPNTKPNYWVSFYLNIDGYFYRTLLDFDPNKKYVEIVGWLSENQKSFIEVINRCDREGGQILIRN